MKQVQVKGSNCMGCICNFCPLRGKHCDSFGCKSCEIDPDSGSMSTCESRQKVHKCATCKYEYPTCSATNQIEFGDGLGDDNVIYCSGYQE